MLASLPLLFSFNRSSPDCFFFSHLQTEQANYYRGAAGILLVYDMTDRQSFENIRNYIKDIKQHASETVRKILLGNKCDVDEKRAVSTEEGQKLADEFGIQFFETSAKSGDNVENAFFTLVKDIRARQTPPAVIGLPKPVTPPAPKKGCC